MRTESNSKVVVMASRADQAGPGRSAATVMQPATAATESTTACCNANTNTNDEEKKLDSSSPESGTSENSATSPPQPQQAFSVSVVPTVSVEAEKVEDEGDLGSVWRVPSCAADFTQQWVQFVMQQYYANIHGVELTSKIENFTAINMAGSPDVKNDQHKDKDQVQEKECDEGR